MSMCCMYSRNSSRIPLSHFLYILSQHTGGVGGLTKQQRPNNRGELLAPDRPPHMPPHRPALHPATPRVVAYYAEDPPATNDTYSIQKVLNNNNRSTHVPRKCRRLVRTESTTIQTISLSTSGAGPQAAVSPAATRKDMTASKIVACECVPTAVRSLLPLGLERPVITTAERLLSFWATTTYWAKIMILQSSLTVGDLVVLNSQVGRISQIGDGGRCAVQVGGRSFWRSRKDVNSLHGQPNAPIKEYIEVGDWVKVSMQKQSSNSAPTGAREVGQVASILDGRINVRILSNPRQTVWRSAADLDLPRKGAPRTGLLDEAGGFGALPAVGVGITSAASSSDQSSSANEDMAASVDAKQPARAPLVGYSNGRAIFASTPAVTNSIDSTVVAAPFKPMGRSDAAPRINSALASHGGGPLSSRGLDGGWAGGVGAPARTCLGSARMLTAQSQVSSSLLSSPVQGAAGVQSRIGTDSTCSYCRSSNHALAPSMQPNPSSEPEPSQSHLQPAQTAPSEVHAPLSPLLAPEILRSDDLSGAGMEAAPRSGIQPPPQPPPQAPLQLPIPSGRVVPQTRLPLPRSPSPPAANPNQAMSDGPGDPAIDILEPLVRRLGLCVTLYFVCLTWQRGSRASSQRHAHAEA